MAQTRAKAMLTQDLRKQYETEAGRYPEGGFITFPQWMAQRQKPQGLKGGAQPKGHLTSTPLEPHAAVGQRYDVNQAYGLAPKNDVDLEQHKGASVMVMPWDSTSRNVRVRGISGHELPEHVTTHGGQDYARDLEHILQGVAGASGEEIAKRIATREAIARMENEKQGGTGQLLHMPITMGERGEDFAMTPTEILHQLVMRGMLPPEELARMNAEIRAHKIEKSGKRIQPFGGFVGLEHPEFDQQIVTGHGLDTTAGELRKAIVNRVGYLKHNQKALDFNIEDLVNAVTDPALRGVPKGYIGNTVIGSDPDHMTLTPSSNKAYDTNFSGQYLGTLGHSFPAEILFGNKMAELHKEFEGKKADPRTMALGALEKRNENISQILNNETLDRYGKYLMARDKKLRTGHYAEGGEIKHDEPSHDEMMAHIMLHGMTSLKDVGANEAPNLKVKTYVPAGPGGGFPVGGVDFQPEQPGQQVMPMMGQPQQSPGQPQQSPGQQQSPAPQGAQQPAPAQQNPQSNILQMTPQGQALAAMRPPQQPPGMPQRKMADGGSTTPSVEEMKQVLSARERDANLAKFLEGAATKDRLYHATGEDFTEFDPSKSSAEGKFGQGIYMTPQSRYANFFALVRGKQGKNAQIMPVHTSIKNPYKIYGHKNIPFNKPDAQKLQELGHDGIFFYDDQDNLKEAIAFHPTQVKSAIGNRGTYDPKEPHINKAAGGTVKEYITITERPL